MFQCKVWSFTNQKCCDINSKHKRQIVKIRLEHIQYQVQQDKNVSQPAHFYEQQVNELLHQMVLFSSSFLTQLNTAVSTNTELN